jgi:hypothetical protein
VNYRLSSTTFCFRNDILRKHGVIPEKPPSPTPIIDEAILQARRLAHENRLEEKDLDELDELEDEEDENFLTSYKSALTFSVRYFPLLMHALADNDAWQSLLTSPKPRCMGMCTHYRSQTTHVT